MNIKEKIKFDLINVVKYCKGPKKEHGDMFTEITKAINLDGYPLKSKGDVLYLLVSRLQRVRPYSFTATEIIKVIGLCDTIKPNLKQEDLLLVHCITTIAFLNNDEYGRD